MDDSPTAVPPEADEAVALRVQAGDKEAFGLLIERYSAKLSRYARKFLASPDDRDDLVQDVFMKAYMNIQSFDATRRFSPWIYRIAHNEFVNALSRRKFTESLFSLDLDTFFPQLVAHETADADAHRSEMRAMLDKGLAQIPPKYREPLVLYYFEDLDYKEIADILHIPVSTVGVRLIRGKKALQEQLPHHAQ